MHNEQAKTPKRPHNAEQPFPWRCRRCGNKQVVPTTIPYEAEIRHDGRVHAFNIPRLTLPVCAECSEKVFTEKVEDQITDAFRAHIHLLAPAEIRAGLDRLQLKPREAAERLGIAEETLSFWLDEVQIQSRAMDNLLRVFFAFPQVRTALSGTAQDPLLGIQAAHPQTQTA